MLGIGSGEFTSNPNGVILYLEHYYRIEKSLDQHTSVP